MPDLPVLPSARSRRRRIITENLQIVQESLVSGVQQRKKTVFISGICITVKLSSQLAQSAR